ncbi:MAG: MarR family transcriptional regulator [Rhizobiales bacterium]|nr:MarR family transcriptional regulator [Hyphomicrobiales bacterium]
MPSLLIATAARMLARVADGRLRDIGISVSQFSVLVPLKDGARLSQKELARLAGVEQPSMAQLLARMERDGLICREPDPTDGRSSLISLSDSALARIGPARTILSQGNQEALAGFDQADIEKLTVLLHRVIANVSGDHGCAPAEAGGPERGLRSGR